MNQDINTQGKEYNPNLFHMMLLINFKYVSCVVFPKRSCAFLSLAKHQAFIYVYPRQKKPDIQVLMQCTRFPESSVFDLCRSSLENTDAPNR